MRDVPLQNICNRLDPAMGMPRKTFHGFGGVIIAEIIEQQERIQHAWVMKPESTVQMNASTLDCGLR